MAYKTVTITFSDGRTVKVIDHKFSANSWSDLVEYGANDKSNGKSNTDLMANAFSGSTVKVLWNSDDFTNYYNDGYYVPSINELEEIWTQKDKFSDLNCQDCLWSSTEEGPEGAWRLYFKMRHDAADALNKEFIYNFCMMKDI